MKKLNKKRKKRWKIIGAFAYVLLLALAVATLFSNVYAKAATHFALNSSDITIYSLEPSSIYATDEMEKPREYAERFHDVGVLGKIQISDANEKNALISALNRGFDGGGSRGMMCFDPRHGIRAKCGILSVDLVICFACQKMDVYTNLGCVRVNPSSSPASVFNAILKKSRIPMAKPYGT